MQSLWYSETIAISKIDAVIRPEDVDAEFYTELFTVAPSSFYRYRYIAVNHFICIIANIVSYLIKS